MVPSSSGLGYRPFTARTRIRIPLGLLSPYRTVVSSFGFQPKDWGSIPHRVTKTVSVFIDGVVMDATSIENTNRGGA